MNYLTKLFANLKDLSKDMNGRNKIIVIISLFLFLMNIFIFSSDSVPHWIKAAFELRNQNKEIVRFNKEISQMERKIDMLSTDKDTLEQFARENFHLSCPGEDVFIIEDND